MSTRSLEIAGLRTIEIRPKAAPRLDVVMLHGYAMTPEDLAPFATSLGVPARFLFPEGPLHAVPAGRAWWNIDPDARARALAAGPRDLRDEHPAGVADARRGLVRFVESVIPKASDHRRLVLAGFSQGGMLACDALLRESLAITALALLSSSRIEFDEWQLRSRKVRGLPVLVSHGTRDPDLAFSAGEGLRDFLVGAGARVTWVPFDSGHEIPLVVWRELRKFLSALA